MSSRLTAHPGFRRVLQNVTWLLAGRVTRLFSSLLVGAWVASYLGPFRFGMLAFAFSFVELIAVIASLGLRDIIVREVVKTPDRSQEILGSAFAMLVISGITAIPLTLASYLLVANDVGMRGLLVAIIAMRFLFGFRWVFICWFKSQIADRYPVTAESLAHLATMVVQVAIILTRAPLWAFAVSLVLQTGLQTVFLMIAYQCNAGKWRDWRARRTTMKSLLHDSWPLMATASVSIMLMVDQVMLDRLAGSSEVGLYAAASRLCYVWMFVPAAIGASAYPKFIQLRDRDYELYLARVQNLYDLFTWLAVAMTIVIWALGGPIIRLLYGVPYEPAATILHIQIFATIFACQFTAQSWWFLSENLQVYRQFSMFSALGLNVILNILMIPYLGGGGAALATMIAVAFASTIAPFVFPQTRLSALMVYKSFLLPARLLATPSK